MSFHHKRKKFPENVTPEKAKPIVIPPPLPPKRPVTAIGYTFCGWATPRPEYGAVPGVQCPAEEPWKALLTMDREPLLGYYDEREPWVTTERLTQCQLGKIDCVAYQMDWAHEHTQPTMRPRWRPVLDNPLINSHCADNHPSDSPIKHFVSFWDTSIWDDIWKEMIANGWSAAEALQSNRLFAREVATRYMTRPNYLHVDGKPVLMRGAADNLQQYDTRFSLDPAQIVAVWKDEIRKSIGTEIYLIATSVDPPARPKLKAWGFDAFTEYLLHGEGWDNTMAVYRHWWSQDLKDCREWGLDYWVPITAGYDGRAWMTPEAQRGVGHMPSPRQFTEHVREARKVAENNYDCTRGMTCIYAMTEFGEGGVVEAMKPGMLHDGDEMLVAHAKACG